MAAVLDSLRNRMRELSQHTLTEVDGSGSKRVLSFGELEKSVETLQRKLSAAGAQKGMLICLQAPNSLDYVVWDLATLSLGIALLTPVEEQTQAEVEQLAHDHGAALIVAANFSGPGVVAPAIDALPEQLTLRTKHTSPSVGPDLHSLVFSSGTTGHLKGIRISRKGSAEVVERFATAFGLGEHDTHLIFLPFSNYQQRMSVYGCIALGVDIVLCPYQRVFQTLKSDPPTFLIAPPVFYDTARQVTGGLGSGRLGALLGGRIRFLITGMAKTSLDTLRTYWDAGLKLFEAYGLTETGMVAWNTEAQTKLGSVGKAISAEEVLFNADGEVVVRRKNPLSLGYFGNVVGVEDVFTDAGILTGDFAERDSEGFITLKGRKKDIIVLNSGKKFHPTEVEETVQREAALRDIVVVCDDRAGLVTAIVPRKSNQLAVEEDPANERRVMRASHGLEPHKRIGRVVFTDLDVLADRQFRTRNLKLDRASVARFFLTQPAARAANVAAEQAS